MSEKIPSISSSGRDISSDKDNQLQKWTIAAFGERVRKRADQLGLRQADLARISGISTRSIGPYWHGQKMVGTDNLFALADALKVDPRWLIRGEEPRAVPAPADAAVTDWIELEGFDLHKPGAPGKGEPVERVPFRRDWLHRHLRRNANLWLTELPGDYAALGMYEGDLVLCADIAEGTGPSERWLCIWRGTGGLFVARYSEADGLLTVGDTVGETYVTATHLKAGEIQPVARIHAQLLARL